MNHMLYDIYGNYSPAPSDDEETDEEYFDEDAADDKRHGID